MMTRFGLGSLFWPFSNVITERTGEFWTNIFVFAPVPLLIVAVVVAFVFEAAKLFPFWFVVTCSVNELLCDIDGAASVILCFSFSRRLGDRFDRASAAVLREITVLCDSKLDGPLVIELPVLLLLCDSILDGPLLSKLAKVFSVESSVKDLSCTVFNDSRLEAFVDLKSLPNIL